MKSLCRACVTILVGLSAMWAGAADRYVAPGGAHDSVGGFITWAGAATNIQAAVDQASPGETVWVANGEYAIAASNSQVVLITKSLSLRGYGGDVDGVIINGSATNRGIYVNLTSSADVLIDGFTVTNCVSGGKGGGIYLKHDTILSGNGVVQNCVIAGNIAGHTSAGIDQRAGGGGLCSQGATNSDFFTVVSNCVIRGNTARSYRYNPGGGVFFYGARGVLQDCEVVGNVITSSPAGGCASGGGVAIAAYLPGSAIRRCTIASNTVAGNGYGGGLMLNYNVTGIAGGAGREGVLVENCEIRGNLVEQGYAAGVYLGGGMTNILRNCLVALNKATNTGFYGGGVLTGDSTNLIENCTIVTNYAYAYGGGFRQNASANEIRNSVIYHNSRVANPVDNWSVNSGTLTVNNTLTTPTSGLTGSGNIATPPVFVDATSDFRLRQHSPGVDAGSTQDWMSAATDLAGQPRVSANHLVDMGAYETSFSPHPGYYVAQYGQTPVSPYTNWVTAASNIQDAVNVYDVNYPSTVWVGEGRYMAPAAPADYYGPSVVVIDKPLILRSSNGVPESTIIDGGGAVRGVAVKYTAASATPFVIDGFTICNGYATNNGGGLCAQTATPYATTTLVQNCTLRDNTAFMCGGGVYYYNGSGDLTVSNCTIQSNLATNSNPVTITNNYTGGGGLHLYGRVLVTDTTIRSNRWGASVNPNSNCGGGGVFMASGASCTFRNSLICGNMLSLDNGSGIYMFVANGGAQSLVNLTLVNCTIVDNRNVAAIYTRRQNFTMTAVNSVIWSNALGDLSAARCFVGLDGSYTNTWITYSCFPTNGMTGIIDANNTTNNPQFRNCAAGDFRLRWGSPCINQGTNQDWMIGARDLAGNVRVSPLTVGGTVDMGAYEFPIEAGSIFLVR